MRNPVNEYSQPSRILCAVRWKAWAVAVLAICIPCDVFAAITTDTSLGHPAQVLTGPNYLIPETLGKLSGSNLFHSFQTFNISTGESANFTTATPAIANVISRVTGGSLSQINGLLSLTPCAGCGAPNFFFINPAGVTFGEGASIDVPGAFHVSTANFVKFPDGNFHADLNQASTFSSAPPEAFGFLGTTRASVTVNGGAAISTQPLQPISIVGGDVEINNGIVSTVDGGDIRVVALGQDVQVIECTGVLPAAGGNLSILNGGLVSSSSESATDAGYVKVSAGNIAIDGGCCSSSISSMANTGNGNAGSVEVTAANNLSIVDGGTISSDTYGSGTAGSVKVNAGSITIDARESSSFTGIASSANTGSSGNAGSVNVGAGTLLVDGIFSSINALAAAGSSGQTGNVVVNATNSITVSNGGRLAIYNKATAPDPSILTQAALTVMAPTIAFNGGQATATTDGNVNAGLVNVSATENLSIVNNGYITSSTRSSGDAGSVRINAGSITIDGQGSNLFTGIASNTYTGSTGNAGTIEVTAAGNLSLINTGIISSSTKSSGDAGSVKINADSITIDGQGSTIDGQESSLGTGIASNTYTGSAGNAGVIEITAAGNLSLINTGIISSSTRSSGDAGSVKIIAGSISIDGQGSSLWTGIASDTNSTGNSGAIEITIAGNLSFVNGGYISATTISSGNAGSIKINADSIFMDRLGSPKATFIVSNAGFGSTGNAGTVEVNAAGNLSIVNGAYIASDARSSGNAGSVKVNAGSITIDGQGSLWTGISSDTVEGSGNAGSVEVTASGNLSIINNGKISSQTYCAGSAGLVNVNAGTLWVDGPGSSISALAEDGSSGQTGNVVINATGSITISNNGQFSIQNNASVANSSEITPTSISIAAPRITLLNSPYAITTSSTGNIAAGSINITASDRLYLDLSAITTTSNLGNGGTIDITTVMLRLDNSQIATSVLGLTGNGGNIASNANALVLNTGFIQANTAAANAIGGTVSIATQNLVPSGNTLFLGGSTSYPYQPGVFGFNVIQAAAPTGVSGAVQTTTPVLDVSGSLGGFYVQVIDTGGLSRSPCQTTEGSSLAQSGRGGLPPSASGLLRAEPTGLPFKNGHHAGSRAENMSVALSDWWCG